MRGVFPVIPLNLIKPIRVPSPPQKCRLSENVLDGTPGTVKDTTILVDGDVLIGHHDVVKVGRLLV